MHIKDLTLRLGDQLENQGYKGKILSVAHVYDLQKKIETQYQQGLFDAQFYDQELTGFDFNISRRFPQAKSLIIVAAPQPQVRIQFMLNGRALACMIPPTYSHATDKSAEELLELRLKPAGYRLQRANLPLKLLAVRSGLARYGRNNITYVRGIGSFHRLVAFICDLPCHEDGWGQSEVLEGCDKCKACMKACPTGAIAANRFLLYAERCITFHNEKKTDLPNWIKPAWHRCLVGCLYCQQACPLNKDLLKHVSEGPTFCEAETSHFLRGTPKERIPQITMEKLEKLDFHEDVQALGRNLRFLQNQSIA